MHFSANEVNTTHTAPLENHSVAGEGYTISFVSDNIVPHVTHEFEADFNLVEEYISDSHHSDVDSADFDLE